MTAAVRAIQAFIWGGFCGLVIFSFTTALLAGVFAALLFLGTATVCYMVSTGKITIRDKK